MASKPSLSVRRLINHTRTRSDDISDSPSSLTSPDFSRKHANSPKRPQISFPVLGKVGSTDSGSSKKIKQLQISSPQVPDEEEGDSGFSDVARSGSLAYRRTHRRNVSEGMAAALKGSRRTKTKTPMSANDHSFQPIHPDYRPGGPLQRSASMSQKPPRPPRPDEVLPPVFRRPSLKSISSDSFIETKNRVSLAVSDPGSIAFERRSKDDSDSATDVDDFSAELRGFILEANRAFHLDNEPIVPGSKSRKAEVARKASLSKSDSTSSRSDAVSRPPIPRKRVGSGSSVRRANTTRPLKPSATMSGRVDSAPKVPGRDQPVMARRNSAASQRRSRSVGKKPTITMPRKKRSWDARRESKSSRWALSDGVTDIFTGQRFKRMEVNEMITPDRLEKFRQQREAEEQKMKSQEDLEETLTEETPFDRNSSWIDIGLDTSEEDSDPSLSPSRSKTSSPDPEHALPQTPMTKHSETDEDIGEEIPIMFQGYTEDEDLPPRKAFDPMHDPLPPTPPPKSYLRKLQSNAGKSKGTTDSQAANATPASPDLPGSSGSSVYTDATFSPGPATPVDRSELRRKLSGAEDDINVYLRSTPYTLTQPGFQHGAITFSKADMGVAAVKLDDTLDWTAFQMAILGGAGDMGEVVDEWEDARLSEELVKWFDGHGFENWGRMVLEDEAVVDDGDAAPAPAPFKKVKTKSRSKTHSPSDSVSSDSSSASSLASLGSRTSRTGATPPPLNIRRKQPALPTLTSRCMPSNDGSLGQGLPSVVQGKSPGRGPAIVGGGGPGDVEEEEADAPMGFNLSSDLGEYLQYEAEYAYATDL